MPSRWPGRGASCGQTRDNNGGLRVRQLACALRAVREHPGSVASQIGVHVPVHQPDEAGQAATGLLAVAAPLTLTLALLRQLETAGKVRHEDDLTGACWYPVGGDEAS